MNLNEKIKALIAEGKKRDEAVAIAYQMLKEKKITKDSIAIATIVKEGQYMYEEGPRYKEYEELKKSYTNDLYLPVHADHDEGEVTGIAYDFLSDDKSRSIMGKIAGDPLPPGAGVSAGFTTVEVKCRQGTCQKDMVPQHVAASKELIPRGADNKVIIGASDMGEDIKKAVDSATAELKKELDGYKEKERKALADSLQGKFKESYKLDAMCIHDLNVVKGALDNLVVEKKEFFKDSAPVRSVIKTKGDGEI